MADGTRSNNVAKKRGTFVISIRNQNGNFVTATLENTLYIPSYPQCIFSVQAATQKGAKVNFKDDSAELITSDETFFPIEQHGRLYYLYKASAIEIRFLS